jgi:Tfp pilus assembly protein PilO
MSPFFKAMVALIVVSLMGVGFWVMMYQPKQKEIISLDSQIAEQKQKYEEYKVESQNLAQWELARGEFQKVLERLHQTGPMKDFIPSFLTDIEKMAKEERASTNDPSFQVTSITPGSVTQEGPKPGAAKETAAAGQGEKKEPPVAATSQLQSGKSVIQLSFTGRFNTIVDFLQQLGNFKLNKLVTIQRISLTPQGAVPGLSPTLTVTMPFEVYMLGGGG